MAIWLSSDITIMHDSLAEAATATPCTRSPRRPSHLQLLSPAPQQARLEADRIEADSADLDVQIAGLADQIKAQRDALNRAKHELSVQLKRYRKVDHALKGVQVSFGARIGGGRDALWMLSCCCALVIRAFSWMPA